MGDRSTPSAARAILARHGLHPKKRLGQNFLVDRNVLSKIADTCGAGPEQYLVEIGPGLGALTQELAQRGRGVLAIEIDTSMEPILQELAGEHPNLRLLFRDILAVDIEAELCRAFGLAENVPYQVCANIPYNITSPILFQLLEECPHMQSATLMMQKEVAERILAQPGSKDYGRLTLTTAYYAEVEQLMQVSRNCFLPRPDVDSVVLKIVPHNSQRGGGSHETDLKNFIKAAFSKRRKTILNICSGFFDLEKAAAGRKLQELGLAANLRPENLNLEAMTRLVEAFAPSLGVNPEKTAIKK
ncbi:MAG: 16S rRNA (adenine(1518)-N(6)/adenine(1519)-N(6))-dimethyltransferase RsmA [Firmicutes bacterium]|nr:16S rRNA (adenine(1518)-N(6)/adenine(1519)-N(6))-dimethyltransferase RsmA [Bacillota bacterium]